MTRESLCDAIGSRSGETAVRLFDWTQNAAEIWRGSNSTPRRRITPEMKICERRILDLICLNRNAGDLERISRVSGAKLGGVVEVGHHGGDHEGLFQGVSARGARCV